MRHISGFIRWSREVLGGWGQFVVAALAVVAVAVGLFGTEQQRNEGNTVAQLLSIAPWYLWAIAALATALGFALVRSYRIVEDRTRGFRVFADRGTLARFAGTFAHELADVERAWLIAPVGTTLQAASDEALSKIDRAIFTDIVQTDFAPYTKMLGAGSKIFRPNLYQITKKLQGLGKQVRWHRHPTIGVVIANPHSTKGWARLELLLPYVGAPDRPSIIVSRIDRPDVFDRVVEMFEETWKNASEPDWAALPDLYPPSPGAMFDTSTGGFTGGSTPSSERH
jgi:hypothetical protein